MPPYIYFNKSELDRKPKFIDGLEVNLIHALKYILNFTLQINYCNQDWGVKLVDNNWTGLVGTLARNVCYQN